MLAGFRKLQTVTVFRYTENIRYSSLESDSVNVMVKSCPKAIARPPQEASFLPPYQPALQYQLPFSLPWEENPPPPTPIHPEDDASRLNLHALDESQPLHHSPQHSQQVQHEQADKRLPIMKPRPRKTQKSVAGTQPGIHEDTPGPRKRRRFHWCDDLEEVVLLSLLESKKQGLRADSGWTQTAKEAALAAARADDRFDQVPTKDQLMNKLDTWKRDWQAFKMLLQNPGFRKQNDSIIADDESWEPILRADKKLARFRHAPLPCRALLFDLFDSAVATVWFSQTVDNSAIDPQLQMPVSIHIEDEDEIPIRAAQENEATKGPFYRVIRQAQTQKRRAAEPPLQTASFDQVTKRTKPTMADEIQALSHSLIQLAQTQTTSVATTRMRAVQQLQLQFPDLADDSFDNACSLLQDEVKMEIFLGLEGERRNQWLLRRI